MLLIAHLGGFAWPLVFLYVAALAVAYNTPLMHTTKYLASFVVLSVASALLISRAPDARTAVLTVFLATVLWYIHAGIKNFFFIYRERWHYACVVGISYELLLVFFSSNHAGPFWIKAAFMFAALASVWHEYMRIQTEAEGGLSARYARVGGTVLALILVEAAWAIQLLPVAALQGANISMLVFLVASGAVRGRVTGGLVRWKILALISICTFLIIFTLLASSWAV